MSPFYFHFAPQVKVLYHRVMNEISSLKNLWTKALSIPGTGEDDESTVAKQQVELSSAVSRNEIN